MTAMTDMIVRRAIAADVPAVVALLADDPLGQQRERVGDSLHADYTAAFAMIAADPNQYLAVCTVGDDIIGCVQISFIPGLTRRGALRGQIEGVRIADGWRGRGYGRQLLLWAIDTCRHRGCRLVQLTSDRSRVNAQRFYKNLGFARSHDGFKLHL
jgi:ribosomal protein S18 acetylase RimI-like enzyme